MKPADCYLGYSQVKRPTTKDYIGEQTMLLTFTGAVQYTVLRQSKCNVHTKQLLLERMETGKYTKHRYRKCG